MSNSNQVVPATRIGVFATQNDLLGTAAVAGFTMTPCIIGTTSGADTVLQNQPVLRLPSPGVEDQLAYDTTVRLIQISDSFGGVANYTLNVDYSLDLATSPMDSVHWLGTVIGAPTGLAGLAQTITPVSPRTGLAAATWLYKITAIRLIALPSTNGETTGSNEVSVVASGPNNAVKLNWTPVPNAQGYNIYRVETSGSELKIATVIGGASSSFLDDGYADGSGGVPVSNTATNRPADGATYFVTYEAIIQNYFNPTLYFGLNDLIQDHGLSSDCGIAGTLILGGTGLGAGASQCMVVSVPDETEDSYLEALNNILTQNVQMVVPLVDNDAIALDVANHCVLASSTLGQHPRNFVIGASRGTPTGDPNTVGTLVYKARRLVITDSDGVPQGRRGQFVSNSGISVNVQQTGGLAPVLTQLNGYFLAAAHAGLVCSLPDVATSATFQTLQGIVSLDYTFTPDETDYLQQNGLLTYFLNTGGIITCYQDRTLDTLIVENQERSIVSADDQIFRDLLVYFANYVGRKITPNFLSALSTGTANILGNEQKNQIITTFNKQSIVVSQPFADKRIVIVTFMYTPIYPCNQLIFSRAYNV